MGKGGNWDWTWGKILRFCTPFLYATSRLPFFKSWSVFRRCNQHVQLTSTPCIHSFVNLKFWQSFVTFLVSDEAMSHSWCMSHTVHRILLMGCAGMNNIDLMVPNCRQMLSVSPGVSKAVWITGKAHFTQLTPVGLLEQPSISGPSHILWLITHRTIKRSHYLFKNNMTIKVFHW